MGRRKVALGDDLLGLSAQMRKLAVEQGGVVDTRQCRGLGADDGAIRRLVGAGELVRARRGIYRPARLPPAEGTDVAHHARCAALLAGLRGPAAVSHTSALRLLGFPSHPAEAIPGPASRGDHPRRRTTRCSATSTSATTPTPTSSTCTASPSSPVRAWSWTASTSWVPTARWPWPTPA